MIIKDIENFYLFFAIFVSHSLEFIKQDISCDDKVFNISLIQKMLTFRQVWNKKDKASLRKIVFYHFLPPNHQSLLNNQFGMNLKWFDILLIQEMNHHLEWSVKLSTYFSTFSNKSTVWSTSRGQ